MDIMVQSKRLRELPFHLMLLPAVIMALVFSYIPMIGLTMAFRDFNPVKGMFLSDWTGLKNILYVFHLPNFYQVLWNTVFIASMKIIAGLIVPVLLALLLNEVGSSLFRRSVQTVIYLPNFISWVIMGGIIIDVLSKEGIVNNILSSMGIKPVFFMGNESAFPFIIVITDLWKGAGYFTIIYLAALANIDIQQYEAAIIDGANRWKQTIHITLPGMKAIIILMAVLSLGGILNAGFDQVFNLLNPLVYKTGDILDTMIYRLGMVDAQYGVAAALGMFRSLVSFIFVSASYWMVYKFSDYRIF